MVQKFHDNEKKKKKKNKKTASNISQHFAESVTDGPEEDRIIQIAICSDQYLLLHFILTFITL